jgi:hypothetical protein
VAGENDRSPLARMAINLLVLPEEDHSRTLLTVFESNLYTEINWRRPRVAPPGQEISHLASHNNKLARLAKERREKNKSGVFDNEPTIEDRLARLEEEIRRLKVEFDVYFNGGSKRPPYDTKMRVESHLKRLGDDRSLNFAQRYHYNSLATRYASFREMWRRTTQGREEGRDVAAAARASKRISAAPFARSEFSCSDVRHDVQTVKGVYDALMEAKRNCGESTNDLSFARFHRLIMERTATMKEKIGSERVVFSVAVESGHVSFKAKAEK